jgi:hypothetical protein
MAALSGGSVTAAPETHYTRSADGTNLAYQVSGIGPLDLVFVGGPPPIELLSEDPGCVRVRRRLGTLSATWRGREKCSRAKQSRGTWLAVASSPSRTVETTSSRECQGPGGPLRWWYRPEQLRLASQPDLEAV